MIGVKHLYNGRVDISQDRELFSYIKNSPRVKKKKKKKKKKEKKKRKKKS